jgi:hypothetical protein
VVVLNEFDARGGHLSSRSGAIGTTLKFTVHSLYRAFTGIHQIHINRGSWDTHGTHGRTRALIAVDGGVADTASLFLHRPLLTEMPHSAVFLFG